MGLSPKALPLVLGFVLFWSLEIFATKVAFVAGAKILPFTIQSSACAFLALGIWTVPRERNRLYVLFTTERRLLGQICLANSIHFALGSFLYCCGVSLTNAINVAFLVTLCTPFSSVMAVFIVGEQIPLIRSVLLVTLSIGAYILTTNLQALVPQSGDALIVCAAFFWSLGNVLMRRILRDSNVSGEVVSLLKPVVGILLFAAASLFANFFPPSIEAVFAEPILQFEYFGYAAVAGIFCALLWVFLYRSLKVAESAYVSMLGMATPVIVSLLAVTFLGERISSTQLLGGLIILASGVMTHRTARPARAR